MKYGVKLGTKLT